jgi:hypothetical protein
VLQIDVFGTWDGLLPISRSIKNSNLVYPSNRRERGVSTPRNPGSTNSGPSGPDGPLSEPANHRASPVHCHFERPNAEGSEKADEILEKPEEIPPFRCARNRVHVVAAVVEAGCIYGICAESWPGWERNQVVTCQLPTTRSEPITSQRTAIIRHTRELKIQGGLDWTPSNLMPGRDPNSGDYASKPKKVIQFFDHRSILRMGFRRCPKVIKFLRRLLGT